MLAVVKEKTKQLDEVPDRISFFFTEDYPYDTPIEPVALEKLAVLADRYAALAAWAPETIEAELKSTAIDNGWKNKDLIAPTRLAVSGRAIGPSLWHMMEVLGCERTVARIRRTVAKFAS